MIHQGTAIIPLNSIYHLVFMMEIRCVFFEVGTEIVNMVNSSFSVSLGNSGFGL
jgi:hypothetical protein